MPVLKALKAFSYNKVKLQAGDLFKCKDKHVPILVHSHLATMPEVEIAKPTQVYQTRHMEAEKPRTVSELRAEAEAKGVHLPSGYITKSELMNIIEREG